MNWNNDKVMVYPLGLSGQYSLSIDHSRISHFEILNNNLYRLIECDVEEKWMKVKEKSISLSNWNEIKLNELKKEDIVDLSDKGDRWEGTSLQGNPFGYGCIYDDENRLIYIGFIYEGMKVCFGCVFYGDMEIIEYIGNFYQNERHGYGILYDKKGKVIYDGEWCRNNPIEFYSIRIERELKENDICYGIEELIICDKCVCDIKELKLNGFNHLKRIEIGNESFRYVKSVAVMNCNELQEIITKKDSFYRTTSLSLSSIF